MFSIVMIKVLRSVKTATFCNFRSGNFDEKPAIFQVIACKLDWL